jgi:hypothetical protein
MPKPRTRKTATVVPIESPSARGAQSYTITDGEISRRAYEIFCERGFQHGRDVEDWLQAEHELRTSVTAAVA